MHVFCLFHLQYRSAVLHGGRNQEQRYPYDIILLDVVHHYYYYY